MATHDTHKLNVIPNQSIVHHSLPLWSTKRILRIYINIVNNSAISNLVEMSHQNIF